MKKKLKIIIILSCIIITCCEMVCFMLLMKYRIDIERKKERELDEIGEYKARSIGESLVNMLLEQNAITYDDVVGSGSGDDAFDDVEIGIYKFYEYYYFLQKIHLNDYKISILSKYYPNNEIDRYAIEITFIKNIEFVEDSPISFDFDLKNYDLFLECLSEYTGYETDCSLLLSYYNEKFFVDDFSYNNSNKKGNKVTGYECFISPLYSISYKIINYDNRKESNIVANEGNFYCILKMDITNIYNNERN